MPRPGPRPYECVRRAWHSDRHQPMRGSLIQEIFRVVDEIHSSATKKNREWQEKLPIVVLKAEEIMYSKANSEAEYIDPKTLFDRANDAINTIIRRDESIETGELLQPCIEAALNLGCTPRRASRSQRHNNPRFYLNPNLNSKEPTPNITDNTAHRSSPHLLPLQSANRATNPPLMSPYSTFTRTTPMNSARLGSGSCTRPTQENKPINDFPSSSNLGSVYPLYYGTQIQTKEPHLTFQNSQNSSNPNTVFVGTPVKPPETGILRNLFSIDEVTKTSNRASLPDYRHTSENPLETECDLSLRLGLGSAPSTSSERSWAHEVEDVGSSSSQEGNKHFDQSVRKEKGFSFFPKDNGEEPLESCSSKFSSEGEGIEATIKKRKKPTNSSEERLFCLNPKLSSNHFLGRMRKPGF